VTLPEETPPEENAVEKSPSEKIRSLCRNPGIKEELIFLKLKRRPHGQIWPSDAPFPFPSLSNGNYFSRSRKNSRMKPGKSGQAWAETRLPSTWIVLSETYVAPSASTPGLQAM